MPETASDERAFITVVSGLPRSGTSLMMQMLAAGGMEPLTDRLRPMDDDNPRGYFEFEAVKKLKHDSAWLPQAWSHSRAALAGVIGVHIADVPSP